MLDELRDQVASFLSRNHVCVISTNGALGAWAALAHYDNIGLTLNCRLPRWADVAYFVEQSPLVMVIIREVSTEKLRWLQYRGVARIADSTDDQFVAVQIVPERVDLIDESKGWGARETLEM